MYNVCELHNNNLNINNKIKINKINKINNDII